jgi:nucleoside-diphosphate-sugar epimerase
MRPKNLIVGYGDIGKRVARLLAGRKESVSAVSRRTGEPSLSPEFILQADLDLQRSLEAIPTSGTRVLYLAPPPGEGRIDSRMRNFCDLLTQRLPEQPNRIVYVSTSGVYGDCAGEWVDETRPVNPQTDRAYRRVDAEQVVQHWGDVYHVPVTILRVAGIYGPGRLPVKRLLSGLKVLPSEQSPFSNRVHADDLARICLAALDRVEVEGIYNVCDGEQSRMTDYFVAVAREFDLPEPVPVDRKEAIELFSQEMLSYLSESRRLNNRRMLKKLGVTLLYPTLKAGLMSIRQKNKNGENEI